MNKKNIDQLIIEHESTAWTRWNQRHWGVTVVPLGGEFGRSERTRAQVEHGVGGEGAGGEDQCGRRAARLVEHLVEHAVRAHERHELGDGALLHERVGRLEREPRLTQEATYRKREERKDRTHNRKGEKDE